MSERVPAHIRFGGKLEAQLVPELIALLEDQCLRTSDGEQDPDHYNLHEEFYDAEVKSGDLSDLEDFAARHGLSFEQWCDSGSEWMEITTRYSSAQQRIAQVVGSRERGFYLSEAQLKHGAELLTWMKLPLPALEIIGAEDEPAGSPAQTARQPFRVRITQVRRIEASTIISVQADNEQDLLAMIDEGSIDVPCANDGIFGVWTTDHSSVQSETQELI